MSSVALTSQAKQELVYKPLPLSREGGTGAKACKHDLPRLA